MVPWLARVPTKDLCSTDRHYPADSSLLLYGAHSLDLGAPQPHSCPDFYVDACSVLDAYGNVGADYDTVHHSSNRYGCAPTKRHRDGNIHADHCVDAQCDAYCYSDAHPHFHADADGKLYANRYSDTYGHRYVHGDAHRYTYGDTNAHGYGVADAD